MGTLKRTTINYYNHRVELEQFKSGGYYICDGCSPLGFADTLEEAENIYKKKVRAFRAKRTRELNQKIKFVKENIKRVDFDLVLEVFKRDFNLEEAEIKNIFNK